MIHNIPKVMHFLNENQDINPIPFTPCSLTEARTTSLFLLLYIFWIHNHLKHLLNKSLQNLSKRLMNVKADAYLSGEIILSRKQLCP